MLKLRRSWRVSNDEQATPQPSRGDGNGGGGSPPPTGPPKDNVALFEEAVRVNSRRLLAIARHKSLSALRRQKPASLERLPNENRIKMPRRGHSTIGKSSLSTSPDAWSSLRCRSHGAQRKLQEKNRSYSQISSAGIYLNRSYHLLRRQKSLRLRRRSLYRRPSRPRLR